MLRQVEAQVEAERAEIDFASGKRNTKSRALTVTAFCENWIAKREHVRSVRDEATRLRRHALPIIGKVRLREVHSRHIREVVEHLRGSGLAPRTQLHVYSSLKTMFNRAVRDGVIAANPCNLDKSELPKKRDKDLGWRVQAVFTRAEVVRLLTDRRIPWVRRVFYALVFLTGGRFGEVAALQWSDLIDREPLEMLHVYKSWDTKAQEVTDTKTEEPREVPVHPTLAAILNEWRREGFEITFGRPPSATDLIVPSPKTKGKGRRIGGPTTHWRSDTMRKRIYGDCDLFGWRRRSTHDGRATFITLAEDDGCGSLIHRVTHAPPRTVRQGYVRGAPWRALCAEMMKLQIELPNTGGAADAATGDLTVHLTSGNMPESKGKRWSRRESNPRPEVNSQGTLRACSLVQSRPAAARATKRPTDQPRRFSLPAAVASAGRQPVLVSPESAPTGGEAGRTA